MLCLVLGDEVVKSLYNNVCRRGGLYFEFFKYKVTRRRDSSKKIHVKISLIFHWRQQPNLPWLMEDKQEEALAKANDVARDAVRQRQKEYVVVVLVFFSSFKTTSSH